MTSKSPARSAEDVDEQALSYAEIKALAAGNPEIKEKMDLDVAVTRLNLLKASHLSQRYALEDRIAKEFPKTIASLQQRIDGYNADIATGKAHPVSKDSFPTMRIKGIDYDEKAAAGQAILNACKAMTSPDPVRVGSYRGFLLDLSFDGLTKSYVLTLVGQFSHPVTLGDDIFGNITRIDNAIDGLDKRVASCQEQLATAREQLEAAKIEVQKPFPQEQELAEKLERLQQLNVILNMDEKESVLMEGDAGEKDENAPPCKKGEAR